VDDEEVPSGKGQPIYVACRAISEERSRAKNVADKKKEGTSREREKVHSISLKGGGRWEEGEDQAIGIS